jgi:hypothetical protein
LRDHSVDDILAWLAARGRLSKTLVFGRETYLFESAVGREAVFFFEGDQMVFIGDNTTFR